MNEKDEVTSPNIDEPRRVVPLRPYAKRRIWAAWGLLIVAGAVLFYLYFTSTAQPWLTVVGGNPISVGDWPCGKQIAAGITLRNDSGRDVVLSSMNAG